MEVFADVSFLLLFPSLRDLPVFLRSLFGAPCISQFHISLRHLWDRHGLGCHWEAVASGSPVRYLRHCPQAVSSGSVLRHCPRQWHSTGPVSPGLFPLAAFSRRHFPVRISRLGCLPWLSLLLGDALRLSPLPRGSDGGQLLIEPRSSGSAASLLARSSLLNLPD
jgi:hypothetical protein